MASTSKTVTGDCTVTVSTSKTYTTVAVYGGTSAGNVCGVGYTSNTDGSALNLTITISGDHGSGPKYVDVPAGCYLAVEAGHGNAYYVDYKNAIGLEQVYYTKEGPNIAEAHVRVFKITSSSPSIYFNGIWDSRFDNTGGD